MCVLDELYARPSPTRRHELPLPEIFRANDVRRHQGHKRRNWQKKG